MSELDELKKLAGITEYQGYQPYGGSNISITGNEKGELIKVWKVKGNQLHGDEENIENGKTISLRRYYKGKHQLSIIVNGIKKTTCSFYLDEA